MRRRFFCKGLMCGAAGMVLVASSGGAQLVLPPLQYNGDMPESVRKSINLHSTPGHALFAVRQFADEQRARFSLLDSLPKDSLRGVVAAYAERFVPKYSNVFGLQHQPYALVAIDANEDQLGLDHFSRWLSTPDLPRADVASALVARTHANIDPTRRDRLEIAERSLADLERLGGAYVSHVVRLHSSLIRAYYDLADIKAMIEHGDRILKIIEAQEKWSDRNSMSRSFPYLLLAQAYSGLPDGEAKIAEMLTRYRATLDMSAAEQQTQSPRSMAYIKSQQAKVDMKVRQVKTIGKKGPDLLAHAWLNAGIEERQAVPKAKSVADGTIRVIEFGYMGCPGCMAALPRMERMSKAFHGKPVEVMYLTWTTGSWDVDLISPDEEVQKLRNLYLDRMSLTIPIGIWAGEKVKNMFDGEYPEDSENQKNYDVFGTPEVIVFDGEGRIRFRGHGADEKMLAQVVNFLLKEGKTDVNPHKMPSVESLAHNQ